MCHADSLNLSPEVLRGIKRKGYRLPTPIQRKTLPLIMQRQDVVGMARTGSGKTAAFVIPMLQRQVCVVSVFVTFITDCCNSTAMLWGECLPQRWNVFATVKVTAISGDDAGHACSSWCISCDAKIDTAHPTATNICST